MDLIDFNEKTLWWGILAIVLDPVCWNIIARMEYYTHIITKICLGNKYYGCYCVGVFVFTTSQIRHFFFNLAISNQPSIFPQYESLFNVVGYSLLGVGMVLVLSSYYQLGITGTYLGDYFGILMENRITGFPFNAVEHPMYYGGALSFYGYAIKSRSPAGILLSSVAFLMYKLAGLVEGPFTSMIYRKKAEEKENKKST